MSNHRKAFDPEANPDLPDDLMEGVEEATSEFGDETQENEERETEEGIEQTSFIELEDEASTDEDEP